jgi:aromatic-amino-acid transaminase
VVEYILARENGRHIPQEDKIFGLATRAKTAIDKYGKDAVINATIGSLLDDDGELVVLESVDEVFKHLSPKDYAEYAPIGGIKPFRESVKKAAFGKHIPEGFIEAVATPGGTGSLRNVISNYSDGGDEILTSDWHWAPYNTIAGEIGRSIATFDLFTEDKKFNVESFQAKTEELLARQESLVIIINTPAHNPTGYSLTLEDWDWVIRVLKEEARCGKAIALVIDVAYIDFAGDEDEYRRFLPKISQLPANVISIVAYSLSKTFTLYGTRCGAMICVAKTREIAEEFKLVCEYSSRGSWSNSAKVAQVILSQIYGDPHLLERINEERRHYRNMLIARGQAFSEEARRVGLEMAPFDAGFFISVPCDKPEEISAELEKENVFIVPLKKGLRVSVASIPEHLCRKLPGIIKKALTIISINGNIILKKNITSQRIGKEIRKDVNEL